MSTNEAERKRRYNPGERQPTAKYMIQLPHRLLDGMLDRASDLGLTPSAWVAGLIERELEGPGR